jgi:hypothetical protein
MRSLPVLVWLALMITAASQAQDSEAVISARMLLDSGQTDRLSALIDEQAVVSDSLGYATIIHALCTEIVAHPNCDRRAYEAAQQAAATVMVGCLPIQSRHAHRIALSIARTNRYLSRISPEEWAAQRSRSGILLASLAQRLRSLIDLRVDVETPVLFELPAGIVLSPQSTSAPPDPSQIPAADRARYELAWNQYQERLRIQQGQVQVRSVMASFRKDLITYLITSFARHPTDYFQLHALVSLAGLESDQKAIFQDVAKKSGQTIPAGLMSRN